MRRQHSTMLLLFTISALLSWLQPSIAMSDEIHQNKSDMIMTIRNETEHNNLWTLPTNVKSNYLRTDGVNQSNDEVTPSDDEVTDSDYGVTKSYYNVTERTDGVTENILDVTENSKYVSNFNGEGIPTINDDSENDSLNKKRDYASIPSFSSPLFGFQISKNETDSTDKEEIANTNDKSKSSSLPNKNNNPSTDPSSHKIHTDANDPPFMNHEKAQETKTCKDENLIIFGDKQSDTIQNKNVSITDLHYTFCNALNSKENISSSSKCFPCYKKQDNCKIYNTYCSRVLHPGIHKRKSDIKDLTNNKHESNPKFQHCQNNQTISSYGVNVCKKFGNSSYYVIISCPMDYPDNGTRKLCEKEVPAHLMTMETVSAVLDDTTGWSYLNKHCADCNGAYQVTPWNISVDCKTYMHVRSALDDNDLLRLSLDEGSNCSVQQIPIGKGGMRCNEEVLFYKDNREVISSCNITGLEQIYSSIIESECQDRPMDLLHRVVSDSDTFKNVFCLICNRMLERVCDGILARTSFETFTPPFKFLFGFHKDKIIDRHTSADVTTCNDDEWMDPDTHAKTIALAGSSSPFKVLFGFHHERTDRLTSADVVTCNGDQWLDREGVCRRVVCAEGKILNDSQCVTAMDEIKGLYYSLRLWLRQVMGKTTDLKRQSSDIHSELSRMLQPLIKKSFEITAGITIDDDQYNPENAYEMPKHPTAWIEAYVEANHSLSREDFEQAIMDIFHNQTIYIENKQTSFVPQFMDENSTDRHLHERCQTFTQQALCYVYSGEKKSYDIIPKSHFINLRPHLTCPYIEIPKTQINITVSNDSLSSYWVYVKINFGDFMVELTKSFEMNQVTRGNNENGTFYICRELLNTKFQPRIGESYRLLDLVQSILTIICVTASFVCLFATVTTYSLFPSLRGVAGCNTLGLSLSMMIAQILLIVTSYINDELHPGTMCVIVGMCVHFSWMAMLTWSFLCCLHMLHVFTTSVRSTTRDKRSEKRTIIRNVTSSIFVPALILGVVVMTSYLTQDEHSIGYGQYRCLFDNSWAINGPLIFVTACNIIFFTIVVYKIWAVRRLQSNGNFRKEDRKDIIVYIKLSALTGMFWFLVTMAESLDDDILRILSILANASQGMSIFVCFIMNRRVLKLYTDKFHWLSFFEREAADKASQQTETTNTTPSKGSSKQLEMKEGNRV